MLMINTPRWAAWTSLAFFVPSIVGLVLRSPVLAYSALAVAICSLAYHLSKEPGPDWWWAQGRTRLQRVLLLLDTVIGLFMAFLVYGKVLASPYDPLGIFMGVLTLLGLTALFLVNRWYEAFHGIWHITAALFITLTILFY
jgi:hypothetical protein